MPKQQGVGFRFNAPVTAGDPVGQRRSDENMFFESVWSALGPETIGMKPDRDVQRWRAQNPGQALASELLGGGVAITAGAALGPLAAARIPIVGLRYAGMLNAAKAIESPMINRRGLLGASAELSTPMQVRKTRRPTSRTMVEPAIHVTILFSGWVFIVNTPRR